MPILPRPPHPRPTVPRSGLPASRLQPGQHPVSLLALGAHGRAGTTTLARLLPAIDLSVAGPASLQEAGLQPDDILSAACPSRLILVTRSSAWAAPLAIETAHAITDAGHYINILAITSDGYPDSPEATARFTALAPTVGAVIRIPYIPSLTNSPDPMTVRLPRRYQRALTKIRAAAMPDSPVALTIAD